MEYLLSPCCSEMVCTCVISFNFAQLPELDTKYFHFSNT